jgi:hypothetical protein
MNQRQQILTWQPRLRTGFAESEQRWVAHRLAPLATRLRSFPDTAVRLDLSVKDRHGPDPQVTLVCSISGRTRLVATSAAHHLGTAVTEVRNDMIRQLGEVKAARIWRKPRYARSPALRP